MDIYYKKIDSDEPPIKMSGEIVHTNLQSDSQEWVEPLKPVTVELKMTKEGRRQFYSLFRRKVPRKLKKAIKKQCPGITPSEIWHLVSIAKIRRIKHRSR